MYTFELIPSHSQVSSTARFYPRDEVIAPQTERNKAAILMLIEAAGCPYSASGTAKANCGPLDDSFHKYGGRKTDPLGATWQRPVRGARQSVHHGTSGWDRLRPARTPSSPAAWPGDVQLIRCRRWRDDGPLGARRAPGDGRPALLPLLPRAQLELVGAGLLPCIHRGCRGR